MSAADADAVPFTDYLFDGAAAVLMEARVEEGKHAHAVAFDPKNLARAAELLREERGEYETLLAGLRALGVRTRAWEAAVRAVGEERAAARAPARSFARADAVELAEALTADLAAGTGAAALYDRGAFWCYDAARGVWAARAHEEVYRLVAGYAGRPVHAGGGGVRALKLTHGAILGAIAAAAQLAAAPGHFDGAPLGVAFANGFVALDPATGRFALRPHAPEHRATHALPGPYDPAAPCPRWRRYLETVWGDAPPEDRAGRAALLQEWAGAALAGMAPRYQACLVLVGDPHAGKSQALEVVQALFPAEVVRAIAPQQWANRFYLAELAGARLNVVPELPAGELLDVEAFNAVITGEPITADRKHGAPFRFRPRAGHLFACNNLPGTRDQSDGFWRRVHLVVFDRVVPEAERVLGLGAAIVAEELGGVAAWALAGAEALVARGRYAPPPSSAAAKGAWQLDADQVRQFVADCCVVDAAGELALGELYEVYLAWARGSGHAALTRNRLGNRLHKLGHALRSNAARRYALALKPAVRERAAEVRQLARAERDRRLARDRMTAL